MLREVIILPENTYFKDKKFEKFFRSCGYENMCGIKSRTDQRLIQFIKDNRDKNCKDEARYYGEKDKYGYRGYLTIVKVDTSRLWTIRLYDLAEQIEYIDVDKDLNYCEIHYAEMS